MPLTAASLTRPAPKRTSLSSTERVSGWPVSEPAARCALRSSAAYPPGRDLAGPGDAQRALGGRERSQRVAQREILGDGAASGHAREERHRHRHARAHEQRAPGARAQAPAREREHGGRASPPRAAMRAGSAVRGGGGLVHVVGAPKDTVDARGRRARLH